MIKSKIFLWYRNQIVSHRTNFVCVYVKGLVSLISVKCTPIKGEKTTSKKVGKIYLLSNTICHVVETHCRIQISWAIIGCWLRPQVTEERSRKFEDSRNSFDGRDWLLLYNSLVLKVPCLCFYVGRTAFFTRTSSYSEYSQVLDGEFSCLVAENCSACFQTRSKSVFRWSKTFMMVFRRKVKSGYGILENHLVPSVFRRSACWRIDFPPETSHSKLQITLYGFISNCTEANSCPTV